VIQMLKRPLLSYLLLVVAGTLRAEANTGAPIRQTDPRQSIGPELLMGPPALFLVSVSPTLPYGSGATLRLYTGGRLVSLQCTVQQSTFPTRAREGVTVSGA